MRIAIAGATGVVGRHVVQVAREHGHEPISLSRGDGVDIVSGDGLQAALDGTEVIVDVANAGTTDEAGATEFFTRAAGNLQKAVAAQGVGRVVTLSILGIDRAPYGYYAAKLAHERAAATGSVPSTILRATQFHEFAAQLIAATRQDGHARVLDLRVQTVAARTVAEGLIDACEADWQPRAQDLAGPEPADLVDLARAFVASRGASIEVSPDRDSVAGLPADALLPSADTRIAGPAFAQWLDGDDAAAMTL